MSVGDTGGADRSERPPQAPAVTLERARLERRAQRLELVVRELRERSESYASRGRGGAVPTALSEAIAGFESERVVVRRRLCELG